MVEKVDFFEYDTMPTKENEIVVAFKVKSIGDCEIKIPEKTLRDMLAWIDLKTLCSNCRKGKKNPGLSVCGNCCNENVFG